MITVPKRVEIKVVGRVRGVFFRQGVKQKAEELGLTGWVKNEEDGSVRIVAEGEEENLQKLVEWARLGTEWARVDKIDIAWSNGIEEFLDFEIKLKSH